MVTHLLAITSLLCFVHLSHQVCVDVPSETEAVLGDTMRLACIDCLRREEVEAKTTVDWYYKPNASWTSMLIFKFENGKPIPQNSSEQFVGRLEWNGSRPDKEDMQDLSIRIINVTDFDSGIYECKVHRQFQFDFFRPTAYNIKNISLTVKEKATEDPTALYSEIMMYVLLVFLTLWLLVEMVYCYRKISKSDEQAQDTAY